MWSYDKKLQYPVKIKNPSAENAKGKNLNVVRLQALMMPVMDLIIGTSTLLTLLYGGYLAIESIYP